MAPYDLSSLEVVSLVGEPFNPEAWHWAHDTLGRGRIAVNDTWGRSWTGADVKSANFGWVLVANTVRNDSLFTDFSARVNCATVQVCYVP